jgi:hypothetical protein
MAPKRKLFTNLGSQGWLNIGMVGLFSFYIINWVWTYIIQGLFLDTLGVDYLIMWSVGYTANHYGYAAVYDFNTLSSIQNNISLLYGLNPSVFPAPFSPFQLPIFNFPFQFLALFDLRSGFYFWTFLNIVIFVLYLRYFLIENKILDWQRIVIMAALFYYFYFNLFCGNFNIVLMIFMGEFLRSINKKKYILSGLWLCGILIKMQILILIIPYLIYKQKWKTLGSFSFASFACVTLSALMIGLNNLPGLFQLWVTGHPASSWDSPNNMMNLRMLGYRLSQFISPVIAWGIVIVGTLITLYLIIKIWMEVKNNSIYSEYLVYFATISATFIITWHSNTHMEMALIPLMIFFYAKKILPEKLLYLHLFGIPVSIVLLSLLVNLLGLQEYNFQFSMIGFMVLLSNIITLLWVYHFIKQKKSFELPEIPPLFNSST